MYRVACQARTLLCAGATRHLVSGMCACAAEVLEAQRAQDQKGGRDPLQPDLPQHRDTREGVLCLNFAASDEQRAAPNSEPNSIAQDMSA